MPRLNAHILQDSRTRGVPVPCPAYGALTSKVHGFHGRTVADVPVDGRRVVVSVRLRRLVCTVLGCPRQTFRDQVPGLVERYQRRTNRLTEQVGEMVMKLAGRAGARLSRVLAYGIARSTALRMLMRLRLPPPRVPRVIGVDDFTLKRRNRYTTVIIDTETGERMDVLPDRTGRTLVAWLREHPGAEYVYRDGSDSYGEAIRQALPEAVQVSARWHLRSILCGKVLAEIRSHAAYWATAVNPVRPGGVCEQTTRERWQRVHHLLGQGVGLLECARRLDVALNTIKRYSRMKEPTGDRRAPCYRPTLVAPYRYHLRSRRAQDPAVPLLRLFDEIKETGYTGSLNLLYRYILQGRAEGDRPVTPEALRPPPAHPPREPARQGHHTPSRTHRSPPRNDRTRPPRQRVRPATDTGGLQRRQVHRPDPKAANRVVVPART
ncbi:ISL3 family transposase [Streptomyces sp. McG8]|nr:ISL3 family transposase [Streptomyces sp. McG8]